MISFLFFFNDTATTEIYTLSLHDALPILRVKLLLPVFNDDALAPAGDLVQLLAHRLVIDRKSTRLNSSHLVISYAVFCLKKKNPRSTPVHYTAHRSRVIVHLPLPPSQPRA